MSHELFARDSMMSEIVQTFISNHPTEADMKSFFEQLWSDGERKTNLANLPEDVHHVLLEILAEESPASLASFARVCKSLNAVTTPYMYRTIVLWDSKAGNRKQRLSSVLPPRLAGEGGKKLAKHVRHIVVEKIASPQVLQDLLENVTNLRMLSWNTSTHMPSQILDKLQTSWPSLHLCVKNHFRRETRVLEEQSIDVGLLSSPLLHTLDYTAYYTGQGADAVFSEMPLITRIIVNAPNLRILRLCTKDNYEYNVGGQYRPAIEKAPENYGPMRFPLNEGMRFPPLEELSISYKGWARGWVFDDHYCRLLCQAIDWSAVRILHLDDTFPGRLFDMLQGQTPILTSLRVTSRTDTPTPGFIQSSALKELDLVYKDTYQHDLWAAIRSRSDALEKLVLRPKTGEYSGQEVLRLDALRNTKAFRKLKHLGFSVPIGSGKQSQRGHAAASRSAATTKPPMRSTLNLGQCLDRFAHGPLLEDFDAPRGKIKGDGGVIDPDYLRLLHSLQLSALTLFIHVPTAESLFGDKYVQDIHGSHPMPPLHAAKIKQFAMRLAESISACQSQPLQSLRLELSRDGAYDRAQPYRVETWVQYDRNEGDGEFKVKWNASGTLERE